MKLKDAHLLSRKAHFERVTELSELLWEILEVRKVSLEEAEEIFQLLSEMAKSNHGLFWSPPPPQPVDQPPRMRRLKDTN